MVAPLVRVTSGTGCHVRIFWSNRWQRLGDNFSRSSCPVSGRRLATPFSCGNLVLLRLTAVRNQICAGDMGTIDGKGACGTDDDSWSWDTDFEDDSGYEVPLQAGDYEPIGWPPQHSAKPERPAATLSRPLPPVPRAQQQQEDPGGDPPLAGARGACRGRAPPVGLRFGGRPFHLRVRRRTDGRLALGSEKPCERSFDSLGQLVEHHCREPILLTSRGCPAGRTTLALPPLT
ncbi:hypothetical protein MTO96_047599 [Rhipicephalus appendiculatus]